MSTYVYLILAFLLGAQAGPTKTTTTTKKAPTIAGGKIVGGISVGIADYPYQLSLRNSGSHFCGASIIHKYWALTAAHCVVNKQASTMTVKGGSNLRTSGGVIIAVASIIKHPQYRSATQDYDVALLKLKTPFVYSSNISNIPLVSQGTPIPDATNSTTSGWGTQNQGSSSLPNVLQAVSIPVVSQTVCKTAYGQAAITDRMICAGFMTGGKDSCQGDSGGPLVAVLSGVRQLIGVVSWGNGCALPNYPGVYSHVGNMRTWIYNNTGNVV